MIWNTFLHPHPAATAPEHEPAPTIRPSIVRRVPHSRRCHPERAQRVEGPAFCNFAASGSPTTGFRRWGDLGWDTHMYSPRYGNNPAPLGFRASDQFLHAGFTGSNASTTKSGMLNGLQRASLKFPQRSMALMACARETPKRDRTSAPSKATIKAVRQKRHGYAPKFREMQRIDRARHFARCSLRKSHSSRSTGIPFLKCSRKLVLSGFAVSTCHRGTSQPC